jgi:hypothetical protein
MCQKMANFIFLLRLQVLEESNQCGQDKSDVVETTFLDSVYDGEVADNVVEVPLAEARRKLVQNNPSDQSVLLSFKQAITRDPNGTLQSWNVSANADYCLWRGVVCDNRTKRVVAINITGTHMWILIT